LDGIIPSRLERSTFWSTMAPQVDLFCFLDTYSWKNLIFYLLYHFSDKISL